MSAPLMQRSVTVTRRPNERQWGFHFARKTLEVEDVQHGSPIARAGVRKGETILAVNGNVIKSRQEMIELLKDMRNGTTVTSVDLTVQSAVFTEHEVTVVRETPDRFWGVVVGKDLSIAMVNQGMAAQRAGLAENDVITHVNGTMTSSREHVLHLLRRSKDLEIVLTVRSYQRNPNGFAIIISPLENQFLHGTSKNMVVA